MSVTSIKPAGLPSGSVTLPLSWAVPCAVSVFLVSCGVRWLMASAGITNTAAVAAKSARSCTTRLGPCMKDDAPGSFVEAGRKRLVQVVAKGKRGQIVGDNVRFLSHI